MSKKVKALQVTISGSYRTATKEIVDFEDVKGIIPHVGEDLAAMHVRGRYAVMWVKAAEDKKGEKLYTKRIEDMRQVFVDEIKEVDVEQFSFVGKDVRELDYIELQDLATAKDLRKVPLPKETSGASLREVRQVAYVEYAEKVHREFIDINDPEFNYAKLPKLKIDGEARREASKKFTNEEIIEQEQDTTSTQGVKSDLTLEDLKEMADKKGIKYHPATGFEKMYVKIFGTG